MSMNYKNQVSFLRVRNVKMPHRGTPQSAGIDFFVPFYDENFYNDFLAKNPATNGVTIEQTFDNDHNLTAVIIIEPHGRALIPAGVKSYFSADSALIASNKSGVSTKKGLVFSAQVVDADYTGEIHIGVINTSQNPVRVKCGEKLIQFIQTPVLFNEIAEITDSDEFAKLHTGTLRGDGGFGSTGTGVSTNTETINLL